MKYNRFIFILVLFCACSNGQESAVNDSNKIYHSVIIDKNQIELQASLGLYYYKGIPFTGISQEKGSSGQVLESIEFMDGKKDGQVRKYYKDGTLSYSALYKYGKQEGLTSTWWKNGKVRSKSNFEAGVPHGTQEQWYKSGALFKKRNLVLGKEEGLQQSWRENGKLYNNYEAINGRIFGLKRASLCYELDKEIIQYDLD